MLITRETLTGKKVTCKCNNNSKHGINILILYFSTVKLSDGQVVQRHADHIRERTTSCDDVEQSEELEDVSPFPVSSQPMEQEATTQPTLRRSQRIRKPPDQFQN